MEKPLKGLPYRFRYTNGRVSQGGFETFETAVKYFMEREHSGRFGSLCSNLKDVICVPEREVDYLKM